MQQKDKRLKTTISHTCFVLVTEHQNTAQHYNWAFIDYKYLIGPLANTCK